MADMKMCVACAEEILAEAKLCKHCKTRQDDPAWVEQDQSKVVLAPHERRVPMGSMSVEEWVREERIRVDKDSDEYQNSLVSFDASKPPSEGDLVPADCVWAVFPWPGPLPGHLLPGDFGATNPKKFFGKLGDVRGWTYQELEHCAGAPFQTIPRADGGRTVVWSYGGLFEAWSGALYFDRYGVCAGVGTETSF